MHASLKPDESSPRVRGDTLILQALRTRLMQPDELAFCIADFTAEWNRLQAEAAALVGSRKRELEAVNRKLSGLIDAIAEGLRGPGLQQKLDGLEAQKQTLERETQAAPQPRPVLHPNLAEVYGSKVAELHAALNDRTDGTAAIEAARGLIERVILHPASDGHGLEIELIGKRCDGCTLRRGTWA